jgi:YegS/Rv2252/BmrU family lipid kinase
MEKLGCEVQVAVTTGGGDAVEFARSGVQDGVDAIAVYGGDGTVMQAVEGMRGHDVPIGLIPGGTGNLLAGNLRLPRDPVAAARIVASGRPRAIDLGRLDQAGRTQYFAVAAGAGFDADLMRRTSGAAKRRWGFAAYVAQAVAMARALRTGPFRVTIDGKPMEIEATTVLVANCKEFVPRMVGLAPGIAFDDGMLDVVVLKTGGVVESVGVLWHLLNQTVDGVAVRHFRGTEITVETDPSRPVQLDGEVSGETPFTAAILPKALSVLVPA